MDNNIKIKRVLISVYDKTGLAEFVKKLSVFNVEIISTGGTAKHLQENGFKVTNVSEITGFPEILGGRVKTLHPKIHGGILAKRSKKEQMQQIQEFNIEPIDMVIVNLYPFEKTVAKPDVTIDEALENIDIGGPCMIRAAAKNFPGVAVLTDPVQYDKVIKELQANNGVLPIDVRRELANAAFKRTAEYDRAITAYLSGQAATEEPMPETVLLRLNKVQDLRYGENPHQKAGFYADESLTPYGIVSAKKLHGKELSFNNILDLNAAIGLASEFEKPCVIILKHNNPCGAAVDEDISIAYDNAFKTDSVSAYGGIVATNSEIQEELAEKMAKVFLEVIVAPKFSEKAFEILTKKKNIRLIELPPKSEIFKGYDMKTVSGGYLFQDFDLGFDNEADFKVVTKRQPTDSEWNAMRFGWKVVKWVKSNAVIFVNEKQTLGIGAGQMSRVDSSRFAVQKAKDAGLSLNGSVAISDAFFPFRDGVDAAAAAGATAVIQPGGSIRDNEVIEAADEYNMAMVFSGIRHFRH
ncbi:bifunctional phosphoribosylaminoimidazolecarboxamide formyltransferase/IMP cyclohydrolase [candidate division KSB1 bacterium]|nr:bifunctional phosphoribosylaminoimidazolecarboxamide formyltransferase/IMP cyclohydrolase [candidate division KSB1 bacterium]